jgi:hypothetical protein
MTRFNILFEEQNRTSVFLMDIYLTNQMIKYPKV